MIAVPQSTVEKPLTPIDYLAALELCASINDVQLFAEQVPVEVRQDYRFERGVAKRLAAIKDKA